MSHLDEGMVNALLDGEIPSPEIPALEAHLRACEACRSLLEEARALRDEAFSLVELLDSAERESRPAAVVPLREIRPGVLRGRWINGLAWAATVALALSAGFWAGGRDRLAGTQERGLAAIPTEPGAMDAVGRAGPSAPETKDETGTGTTSEPRQSPAAPAGSRPAEGVRQDVAVVAEPAAGAQPSPASRMVTAEERSVRDQANEAVRVATEAGPDRRAEAQAVRGVAKVTAAPESAPAPLRSRIAAPGASSVAGPPDRDASALDAIRLLGGSLRLVDGLVPERIGIVGDTVRVTYATAFGPLLLEQWREGGGIRSRLVAPPAAPADSVSAWERRASRGGAP